MFIGKSYDFLKKRLAKKLLLPLAGYMVFCQNPAVYGGLVINNENAPSAIFAQNMDYELAYDGTDYVDTSDGAGIDGAVVIILDSAEQLIAGFTVGGEVLAVAAGDGGITDQDKIADFYSSNGLNFDGSTNDDFAEADKLAIIDVTSNNLTLAMLESTDVLRGNILKLDGNFNFQLGSVEYGGGVQGIEGSVDTGAGNDELTFDNGAIAGYVNLRDGDNTVTMEGTAIIGWFEYGGTELTTGLTTGSGNDIIQIIDQSHIVGDVYTGEGDDTITIDGTYGAYAGLDDDFTENNIWAGIRNYAVDNDPDPFVDDFEIVGGNLNLGNGDNTLTMLGQSEISGNLIAGSGIDTVTLSGTNITDYDAFVLGDQTAYASHIVGNVYLGAGNDVMTLNGDSFIGDLDNYIVIDDEAIAGDPVTDDADTGNVYLGAGNDSLTLNDDSSIFGDANGDAGNDTIILNNNSSVLGNIDGGDGNDTITLNGNSFVDNDIDGGDGNDIITVNSAASIGGAVLGSGNDQLFYSGINDAVDIATTSGSNFVVLSGVDLVGGSLAGGSANGTAVTRSFDGNSYTFTGDYFLFDDSTSNDGSIFDMNNGSDYTLHLINGSSITDSISLDGDNNTLILDDTSSVVGDVSLDNTSTVKLRGNSVIDGDLTDDATADNITISFEDSAQIDGNVTFNDDPTNVTFNLSGTGEKVTGTITLDADSNNTVNFTNLTSDAGTNFSNFNMDHVDTFKATGGETITLAADETLGAAGKDITFTLSGASFNMGGNTLTLAGDTNKLIFQSSSTFTAATVTGSGNVDTITLTGNSTANADFNLGAGDDIVNLNNSTINGEIDGEGGTDTINLQGSGSLGAITTLTAIENLNVKDAAIWNINSNHTVATFTIEDGGTATVNNGSTLTADVVADGVLNIANGATFNGLTVNGTLTHQSTSDLTASSLNLTNSSTINVLYDGTGSSEILLGGGAVTDVDGINVSIETADALLENGDTISIIRNATSIDSNFYNSTSDSFFQTFNFVTGSSANNLIATVERTAYNDLDCPVAENLNAMLTQLEAVRSTMTGSTEFAEFEKGTQADFEEQAAQINPSALNNLANATANLQNNFVGQIGERLDTLQIGVQNFTLAGPAGPENESTLDNIWQFWADANYRFGGLDSSDEANGYDFNTYNLTLGADLAVDADWIIGAAFSYGQSDIDYDNDAGDSDVDSYSIAAYAKFVQNQLFWDSVLSLGIGQSDNTRTVDDLGSKMDSDADSMIYTLSSQIGYQFEKEDLFFTPIVGLSYSMSSVDGIDEDGSIFAVETDDQDYDSLLSKLGFRTGFIKVMNDEDFFTLEFRSFWYHEFMDTERDLDARFTSGGTEFNVDGIENEEDSFTAGLGFRYDFGSSEVVVEYDYEMSSDFEAHNIGLSWVIRF